MDEFSVVEELINMVKEVSPVIWQATQRQVYAQAISYLIWTVVLVVFIFVAYRFAKIAYTNYKVISKNNEGKSSYDSDDGYFGWIIFTVVLGIVIIVCAGIAVDLAVAALQMFYAPDYHAIRILLETVK